MEHTVQLGAGAFLKTICPNPAKFRNKHSTKNGSASVEDDEEEDDEEEGNADAEFGDENNEGPDDTAFEAELEDGIHFHAGDTLGKLLACITQVHGQFYHPCCKTYPHVT